MENEDRESDGGPRWLSRDAPNGGWRSNKDLQHRRELMQYIVFGLKPMFAPQTQFPAQFDDNKLPRLARQLELSLYRSAPSFEAYADMSTLKHRLHVLYVEITARNQSKSAHTADPPTVSNMQLANLRTPLPMPTSWANQLPADLVGAVGTFLGVESLMNYSITAGPNLCWSITKAYLKKNFIFLHSHVEKSSVFSAFLEINEDWRDFYDNPELLSLKDRQYFRCLFNDIHFAISLGHVELVRHLVEVRGDAINGTSWYIGNIYDVDGASEPLRVPLFFKAIESAKLPVLEYLLGNEALDVNAKTTGGPVGFEGLTCLHFVARKFITKTQHVSMPVVLALLLSRSDIDINAVTGQQEFTALHMAAGLSNSDKHLLPLLLLHKEIDVNATDVFGQTPLCIAVKRWHQEEICEENVKYLIKAGADAEIRDSFNKRK